MEKTLQSGVVSIGVSEVALKCFLLPVLNEYHRRYPGVRLRILNQPTPQPVAALRNGSVDIAVVTTPAGDTGALRVRKVKDYREIAVCGMAFPELVRKSVVLRDLAEYSIVSPGKQTAAYELYRAWFAENGMVFKPDVEVTTADQILPVVKNNLGIGFVPEEFLKGEESGCVFRVNLKEEIPPRSVCYVKRTDQTLGIAARELERMIMDYSQICF